MINLELYRIFIIVANEGNITKASEILNISQPAITKHIHNLEEQLHIKLFNRSKLGVELTEEGKEIYNKINESINILTNIENSSKEKNEIRCGIRNHIFKYFFLNKIIQFNEENREYKLSLHIELIPNMLKQLENYELDIIFSKKALSKSHSNNIKFVKLGVINYVFVTKKGSKYTKKRYTVNELKNERIYTNIKGARSIDSLLELFKESKIENAKNIILFGTDNMKNMLLENEEICYITREFIQEELDEGKFEIVKTDFEIEPTEFGFYYNKNNRFEALDKLMKFLKESFDKNGK